MDCPFCEGTGIHMHRSANGIRFIVNPKRRSCPHCIGTGKVTVPTTSDFKSAAAADGTEAK